MYTRNRVLIERVTPIVDDGSYYAKRVINDLLRVEADLVSDGHDIINGDLKFKVPGSKVWKYMPLQLHENDRWYANLELKEEGTYEYTVEAWVDYALTWQHNVRRKVESGVEIKVELKDFLPIATQLSHKAKGKDKKWIEDFSRLINSQKLYNKAVELAISDELELVLRKYPVKEYATEYDRVLRVRVERSKAEFSTWYEFFPRSASKNKNRTGTLKDAESQLKRIADLGFDVVYLPPIHPIGEEFRKGKNNSPSAKKGEPGSPWAIGSKHGGHKSIHPDLGTIKDFEKLVATAHKLGLEIAMDFALQCSPDHPYVKEHPEWFKWRSDGTVQYAENPPKKYQDILPIYFETKDYKNLWNELLSIALFWADKGIRIFRVDNPHTKPIRFWQWLISEVHKKYPDCIFLSEAFTKPKIMQALAKVGFTQSYTYYTWRNTKYELVEYLTELTKGPEREYFRPNFWPNTPDINPFILQDGSEHAFLTRLFMAATISSNYGIYGPVFEQMVHDSIPGKEEYLDSEKYEARYWDWDKNNRLIAMIKLINALRKIHPALQQTFDIHFCNIENEQLIAYHKRSKNGDEHILCIVNLDPYNKQSGMVQLPLHRMPSNPGDNLIIKDLITDNSYNWHDEWNYIELTPTLPFHLFKIHFKS